MNKDLTMLSVSDIHLGSRTVSTTTILDSLRTMLLDTDLHNVDIIWICGDVYDRMLSLPDPIVVEINKFIYDLLKACKDNDVILRVLEGTPSHDRGQSKTFIDINELCSIDADVKYFKVVAIEYIAKYDINVLYVPDEYHVNASITKNEVSELLNDNGISTVDFGIIHGEFPHQINYQATTSTHDPVFYKRIVSSYLFVGHPHTMTVDGNIFGQGSVQRLSHGQEEDKGIFRVKCFKANPNMNTVKFIKNEKAVIFKTFNFLNSSIPTCRRELKLVKTFPKDSNVRVIHSRSDKCTDLILSTIDSTPDIKWSVVHTAVERDTRVKKIITYNEVSITKETITEMIIAKLTESNENPLMIKEAMRVLNDN